MGIKDIKGAGSGRRAMAHASAGGLKIASIKVLLTIISLAYILPLAIIFSNSFMSQGEIARNYGAAYDLFDHALIGQIHYVAFNFAPNIISLEQYVTLLFKTPMYLHLLGNSMRMAIPIVLMQLAIGSAAAYGFVAWRSRYKEVLFCAYIIMMVLPPQATLVANYIMADALGILDTHSAIVLPWGCSPFCAFIMRQSMKGIHYSAFEAAQIDGAGHMRRLCHIALPLSKGGAASLAILSFADCWAMVEQPMVFLKDAAMEPLSLALYKIGQGNLGLIFAASVFYMLPMVLVFLYGQEYLERGVKLSALK